MKIYKQIIFFFVFFFLSIYCYTQGNLFSKVINGVYDNIGVTNIISRPNKNFYLLGNNDPFVNDAIFIKMDSLGNPLLAKKFFTAFSSIPSNILINKAILTTDSGIFVIGLLPITINNTNFSRAFYAKLDLDGNILWHHTLYNSDNNIPLNFIINDGIQTKDSGFVIVGSYLQNASIIKTDSLGNVLWAKQYATENYVSRGTNIFELSDGSFMFSGIYMLYPSDTKIFISHISYQGEILWSYQYTNNSSASCYYYYCNPKCLLEDVDGYIFNLNAYYQIVLKIDTAGNVIWNKCFPINGPSTLKKYKENKYALSTNYSGNYSPNFIMLDSSFNVIWSRSLFMYISDFQETNDSNIIVAGNGPVMGEKSEVGQIGIIQLDANGNSSACVSDNNIIPTNLIFGKENYPPITTSYNAASIDTILLSIMDISVNSIEGCVDFIGNISEPQKNDVVSVLINQNVISVKFSCVFFETSNFEIYDIYGKKIFEHIISAGTDNVSYDLSFLISSVYLYRILGENKILASGKIIKIN